MLAAEEEINVFPFPFSLVIFMPFSVLPTLPSISCQVYLFFFNGCEINTFIHMWKIWLYIFKWNPHLLNVTKAKVWMDCMCSSTSVSPLPTLLTSFYLDRSSTSAHHSGKRTPYSRYNLLMSPVITLTAQGNDLLWSKANTNCFDFMLMRLHG